MFDTPLYESMVQADRNRGIQSNTCKWINHMLCSMGIQERFLVTTLEVVAATEDALRVVYSHPVEFRSRWDACHFEQWLL